MSDDPLGEVFDLTPMPHTDREMHDVDPDADTDHDLARDNIIALIKSGSRSYEELTMLAETAQNARLYEVLATLLKTLVDSNEALIRLREKRQQMQVPGKRTSPEIKNQHNQIFMTGTTAEFQEIIKSMTAKK